MRHATELLEVISQRRTAFLQQILEEHERIDPPPGQPRYPREAIEQFVNGFIATIVEALEGRTQETRKLYMSTVMPSIRDTGTPLGLMIGGSARMLIALAVDLVEGVKPEHRLEARGWLASFLGEYLGEMADVWKR